MWVSMTPTGFDPLTRTPSVRLLEPGGHHPSSCTLKRRLPKPILRFRFGGIQIRWNLVLFSDRELFKLSISQA